MDTKTEIKKQIIWALIRSTFPIKTHEDLLNKLPNGADTICDFGNAKLRAGYASRMLRVEDFPSYNPVAAAETSLSERFSLI